MTRLTQRLMSACLIAALSGSPLAALAQVPGAIPPPPPPPPSAEAAEWYVSVSGGPTQGPFTLTKLKAMATAGALKPSDQVYSARTGWRVASDIEGLTFAAPPPPPPPPAPPAPPPPPANAQQTLDGKAKAFIVGTWRFEGDVTQGGYTAHVVVEATYRADGSLAGFQSLQFPGYGGMQPPPTVTELKGRYTVTGIDEANFTLTVTLQGSTPQTGKYRIVDRDTLENAADGARSYRIR